MRLNDGMTRGLEGCGSVDIGRLRLVDATVVAPEARPQVSSIKSLFVSRRTLSFTIPDHPRLLHLLFL